jgi:adenylyl-sulfate kinase
VTPFGTVVWFTGRPATGKTTLAEALLGALHRRDLATVHLDSDRLRTFLTPEPSYTAEEREWLYQVVQELAVVCSEGGAIVVVSATAPYRRHRDRVRERVPRFVEVLLRTDESVLRSRDPKGLYAAAAQGTVRNLPGIDAPYEAPENPELTLRTDLQSVPELTEKLLAHVVPSSS